ncbi:MAG: UDP-N-acetylmuramoyl-L-alanine--D-glutamate ligase [Bacteroidales bacterium]|nr:UDP-N-acetylmuramoyl-L-alanine--D-glutamate ligase [Bacteroidales bacterium]MCF6341637.1 UDP-N-acetylmuramoyl-L-alanine--D-glutamate ligase [Bacteroidales bacterium]
MKTKSEIVILGGGESGTGAALLARKKGIKVFLSDSNKINIKHKSVLTHFDIEFEEGGHSPERILLAREVIKSPGIPDDIPLIKTIRKKGIPVISEIEFAARFTSAKTICITGSNGKTTTALLIHHILKNAGLHVGLAGNIGESFAWQVATKAHDVYVLEISSFQLDGMFGFKADIAILLNITPDHLDRYNNDFGQYAASKLRILQNQTQNEALIWCFDDPVLNKVMSNRKIAAKQYPFSIRRSGFKKGAYLKGKEIKIISNKTELTMTLEQLALQGKHNIYNSMAAGIATKLMDIRNESIKQSLSDFHNVPHRLEYVSSVHGITFINDSKATNVNASWYALEDMEKPVVWIAGGIDKGNDYESLVPLVKEKVKAIVCLGKDNTHLHEVFGGSVDLMVDTVSAAGAVEAAYNLARKGEIVLLSPACASFDLFENYEDRGNQFKEAVKKL